MNVCIHSRITRLIRTSAATWRFGPAICVGVSVEVGGEGRAGGLMMAVQGIKPAAGARGRGRTDERPI